MDAYTIASKMQDMATKTKNDQLFNALTRLSDRLMHQGALFEKPLTKSERKIIQLFIKN